MMQVACVQWVPSQHALHHITASEATANEAQQAMHCTVVYCLRASQQFRAGNSVMCLAQWEHRIVLVMVIAFFQCQCKSIVQCKNVSVMKQEQDNTT